MAYPGGRGGCAISTLASARHKRPSRPLVENPPIAGRGSLQWHTLGSGELSTFLWRTSEVARATVRASVSVCGARLAITTAGNSSVRTSLALVHSALALALHFSRFDAGCRSRQMSSPYPFNERFCHTRRFDDRRERYGFFKPPTSLRNGRTASHHCSSVTSAIGS